MTVQTHNGERYTDRLVPGEWLDRITSTDRGGSLRFPYTRGSHVRFDYDEPHMYQHLDGGPRRLVGIEVRRAGEMKLLQRAVDDGVNPLTVWYDPAPEAPFPAIPEGVQVALLVGSGKKAKWDELLAACPHLWALSVSGEPPPPQVLARLKRLSSLRLHVFGATLRDLSWAAEMSDLRVLHLEGPLEITDLRPLSGLRKLQALTLTACPGLSDLGPLRHMPHLARLSLRLWGYSGLPMNNALTDLSPLADVPNLEELSIEGLWSLRDLGPLPKLRRLQALELAAPRVSDVKPLGQCAGLRRLRVVSVKVSDLAPLASLAELRHLDIHSPRSLGGPVVPEGIAALGALKRLESLRLNAPVEDLGPLAHLRNLTQLELADCHQVRNLKPVGTLPALAGLKLKNCGQVADLAPLGELASLGSLHLDSLSRVTDLAPLARLAALEDLRLRSCGGIADLSPLAQMRGLTNLELLACSKLADLTPLVGLQRLRSLWLVACPEVSDLKPLAFLPNLERLGFWNCDRVRDISPLRHMLRRGGRLMHNKDLEQQAERLRAGGDF
ncbi:MAG: hypothetical protein FJ290_01065 [Planctomycetes bacterium]|nr:hypothetical protein [Planctomycetota bacterium]